MQPHFLVFARAQKVFCIFAAYHTTIKNGLDLYAKLDSDTGIYFRLSVLQ